MDPKKYLNGRGQAHEIETSLTVAYYLAYADKTSSAEYHYQQAIQAFAELASALGFTVSPITSEEPIHNQAAE